jgi:formate dehydrogenase subunit gamma
MIEFGAGRRIMGQWPPRMSGRREDDVSRHTAWDPETARAMLAEMAGMPGPALVMLQAVQARFGFVPGEAVAMVADAANLSRAEVHGVLAFYHDLRTRPPAARVVRLCRAEACQAVGAEALAAEAARLGCAVDGCREDAAVAVESVFCLGNCALGPAAMVDGELVAHLDATKLAALLAGAHPRDAQAPA